MKTPAALYRDITTGVLFTSGVLSFVSGAFIFATLFFGLSTVSSNLAIGKPSRARA